MASKSIIAKGTTYNGVESVTFPTSPSGTATFYEVSDTTATASDVLNSKYFYTAAGVKTQGTGTAPTPTLITKNITQNGTYDAEDDDADGYSSVTVNVSGGGGGASNVVGGTYTTGNGGSSETITLPYTGNGFPMQIVFSLAEGTQNSSGTAYNTIHQYGIVYFVYCKINTTAPTYAYDDSNTVSRYTVYKSSANTAHTLSGNSATMESYIFSPYSASGSGWDTVVQINSSTALSVYVSSASGTRGLMPNTAYNYSVVYSE